MNVAAVVMPVRVGADKGLVAGKMLFTELFPQRLRPVYGQAVVRPVPRVKAEMFRSPSMFSVIFAIKTPFSAPVDALCFSARLPAV